MVVPSQPWHARSPESIWVDLKTDAQGLSAAEAARRLQQIGANLLPQAPSPHLVPALLRQLQSPLIAVLLIAAVLSLAAGDTKDASFIAAVLLLNSAVGGLQEWKAERRSHALRRLLRVKALVCRDGETLDRDAQELVPGDAVWLESGQVVPADLRLLRTTNLELDESQLTGESLPVHKHARVQLAASTPVAERCTMAHAGSTVLRGRGVGTVVATGPSTEVGQVARDLQRISSGRPPLLVRMDRFSRNIGVLVAASALLVGWLAMVRGGLSWVEAVLFAVALAVSAIPEGLPVAMTVALAVASHRMAQRQVIVRRLAAVEGLGSCTLIATDKTGTLTRNQLRVQAVQWGPGEALRLEDNMRPDRLKPLARVAALCNEADYHCRDGRWIGRGDPTDLALLEFAHGLGLSRQSALLLEPECNTIPFEPEHRFAASYHRGADGRVQVAVKGAPERLVPMCQPGCQWALPAAAAMAEQGLRVLALAEGELTTELPLQAPPPEPSQLRFLGLLGLRDPLREGVKQAIESAQRAGIRVWMITGDHPNTAAAIARELGLLQESSEVVTGLDLEQASERQWQRITASRCVYARVEPHQKLMLVQAAQARGDFVAVTGDGVNDAPALRAAQIGIAMGRSGTDVAREAADLVLADDGFGSIVAGIEEGRIAYANVRKVIALLVSCGAAEIVLIALAIGFALPLPLLPVQLLWLNLVTNGIQDVALAFEPQEGQVLKQRPRPPQEPIFDRLLAERTLLSALVMGMLGFALYAVMLQRGLPVGQARNVLLLQMVLFEGVQVANCRLEQQSIFSSGPWHSPWVLASSICALLLHLGAMHWSTAAELIGAGPVPGPIWLLLGGTSALLLLAVELQKRLLRIRP